MAELKRKIHDKLRIWKQDRQGKTALLIEGARRVGKSYIVKKFGETEYKSYLLIDFANISPQVLDIFENDATDLDLFFNLLSVFYGVKLYPREFLIIFDDERVIIGTS